MSREELRRLFSGYGYRPHFVEGEEPSAVHRQLWQALDEAHAQIRQIQSAAREGGGDDPKPPRWPMVVLATPKGWTGPEALGGKQIEGTFRAHQLPVEEPAEDEEQFEALKAWLGKGGPGRRPRRNTSASSSESCPRSRIGRGRTRPMPAVSRQSASRQLTKAWSSPS